MWHDFCCGKLISQNWKKIKKNLIFGKKLPICKKSCTFAPANPPLNYYHSIPK